jgi:hypothetical protein
MEKILSGGSQFAGVNLPHPFSRTFLNPVAVNSQVLRTGLSVTGQFSYVT